MYAINLHYTDMIALLLLIISCYHIQSVTAQGELKLQLLTCLSMCICILTLYIVIIRSPVNQLACAGRTVNFTCVVMFTSGTPGAASWFTDNGNTEATALPGHTGLMIVMDVLLLLMSLLC